MGSEGEREGPGRPSSPLCRYAIRVEGHLDAHWSKWLEGMTITHEAGGVTRLEGPLVDQAALYGLLNKLRDLRLPLVTVERLHPAAVATAPERGGSPGADTAAPPTPEAPEGCA
jgi:hypothetical protein